MKYLIQLIKPKNDLSFEDKDKDKDKNILLGKGSFWPWVLYTALEDSQILVCLMPLIVDMSYEYLKMGKISYITKVGDFYKN